MCFMKFHANLAFHDFVPGVYCVLMFNALPYMHVLHEPTNPKPAKFLKFMLFMNIAFL